MVRDKSAAGDVARPWTPRSPGRPTQTSTAAILDAAEAIGLNRLTRADVADRLGVSAGTIRHHVESRLRLYSLTAARIFGRLDIGADTLCTDDSDPGQPDWVRYLLSLGMRFESLVRQHPGLEDYVLRGPYEASTLAQFEGIITQLRGFDSSLTRETAHLLGARTLTLAGTAFGTELQRYPKGTVPPPEPYEDIVKWTLRAFLKGARHLIADGDVPTSTPTPDAEWTRIVDR